MLKDFLWHEASDRVRIIRNVAPIRSMPTGKQNTFANWTRPDAIYVTVRRDQPINMAGAFEKPIRAGSEGYAAGSVSALVDYAKETYADFAAEPECAWTVGKGMEKLAQPGSVNALLDALELWLKFNGEQKRARCSCVLRDRCSPGGRIQNLTCGGRSANQAKAA